MITIITSVLMKHTADTKIQNYLQTKTIQYKNDYNVIYNSYKTIAHSVYATCIDTYSVKYIFAQASLSSNNYKSMIRELLHKELTPTYNGLKENNIKQLHFHLPNNNSFLRFHRPSKFGDNLSTIRSTVEYVNRTHRPIDGFEEGRIYNGYRFVFPLVYKNRYIGSVEVSFATLIMSLEFEKNYKIIAPFLIAKDIVDTKVFDEEKSNYVSSMLDGFYIEKAFLKMTSQNNNKTLQELSEKTKNIIHQNRLNNNDLSIYDSKRKEIMTFIKIENPISQKIVGMFLINTSAHIIEDINKSFVINIILLLFLVASILFIIYQSSQRKNKLKEDNKLLYQLIEEEVEKNRQKDQQMIEQSRLAQMGEMLSMIAHQWRQPLTAISATSAKLSIRAQLGRATTENIVEASENISIYSQHLSQTINEFRNFFRPNKEKEETSYGEIIKSVLNIVEVSLTNQGIKIIQNIENDDKFLSYANEIKQVLLNLIKNAEDVIIEHHIEDPYIKIETFIKDGYIMLEVSDNGGGISDDIIDKIFDPYFSTKDEKNGTGLGLYMSKTIIEDHCKGDLSISNDKDGAVFNIKLKIKESTI